jgi:hypothetical protein
MTHEPLYSLDDDHGLPFPPARRDLDDALTAMEHASSFRRPLSSLSPAARAERDRRMAREGEMAARFWQRHGVTVEEAKRVMATYPELEISECAAIARRVRAETWAALGGDEPRPAA